MNPRLFTDKSTTVFGPTQTLLLLIPETVQLVVKRQLSVCRNILDSEDTDPSLPSNRPFLCCTVWITAVVDEPSMVRLIAGIDDEVTLESEQIEISDGFFLRFLQSLLAHSLVKDLSDILYDKITLSDIVSTLQSPASCGCVEWVRGGRLLLADALVLAGISDRTT